MHDHEATPYGRIIPGYTIAWSAFASYGCTDIKHTSTIMMLYVDLHYLASTKLCYSYVAISRATLSRRKDATRRGAVEFSKMP